MINAAHDEANEIINRHREAMERMVAELITNETVGPDEVAALFSDVPKWEHSDDGLRVRYPEHPEPHPGTIAAASSVEDDSEDITTEVTVEPKGSPRPSARPADAGA
jgi:hypothetical protein